MLSVVGTGSGPLSYQWHIGASGSTTTPMNGATDSIYTTPPLMTTTSYWVRVTGGAGSADSDTATITVATPPASGTAPAITSQPDDQRLTSGESATMTVDASGTSPLSYQWYAGTRGTTSEPVAGATSMRWETPPVTQPSATGCAYRTLTARTIR